MTELEWRREWESALDRLELDVTRAEQLLRANDPEPVPAWTPPVMHMNIPDELIPRARLLLERQLAVANDVARAVTRTRGELALAARVAQITPPDIPVYLDVTA